MKTTLFLMLILLVSFACSGPDEKIEKSENDFYQWGSKNDDLGKDATFDKDGNLYIVSNESLSYENGQLVLTKFDKNSKFLWSKKYSKNSNFFPNKVKVDETGVYVIAYNMILADENQEDIFTANIVKFDKNGGQLWIKDITVTDDGEYSELVDFDIKDGFLYIIGSAFESMASDSKNIFIVKTNNLGDIISKKFLGTDKDDEAIAMVFDSDKANLYILGITQGSFNDELNLGMGDVLVMKIDANNSTQLTWGKTFGTSKTDFATALIHHDDGLFILGHTTGMIEKNKNMGKSDIFLSKVNEGGFLDWSRQFGTDKDDFSTDLIIKDDNIHILGDTLGKLGDKTYGEKDLFLLNTDKGGVKNGIKQFGTNNVDNSFKLLKDDEFFYLLGVTKGKFVKAFGKKDLFKIQSAF